MQWKTASFFHYWQQIDSQMCYWSFGIAFQNLRLQVYITPVIIVAIYKFKPTPLCKSHFMHMMFLYQNYLPSLVVIPFFFFEFHRLSGAIVFLLVTWTSLCQLHNSTVISFNRKSNNQLPSLVLKIYLVFKLSGTIIQWIILSILEITCAQRKLHNGIQINYLSFCIRYYISAYRINLMKWVGIDHI